MPTIKHPHSDRTREVREDQVPLYSGAGWTLVDAASEPKAPAAKKAPAKKAAKKAVARKAAK